MQKISDKKVVLHCTTPGVRGPLGQLVMRSVRSGDPCSLPLGFHGYPSNV